MRTAILCSAVLLCSSLAACSDDASSTGGGGGAGAGGAGAGGGSPTESCSATFHFLQKDAYKETAGRTSDLWPPHTTTLVEVSCAQEGEDAAVVASSFHANHGTEPEAVDANGDVILVDVKQLTASGSRADLEALVAAYEACECDPDTKFLSMDSLGDVAVQELVQNLSAYLTDNLTCTSEGGVDALVASLQAGDIEQVIADLPTCTWAGATTFEEGLDEALSTFLATTQEVLSGYHVCNNDAALQAELFQGFIESGAIVACDGTNALCSGPRWLYAP